MNTLTLKGLHLITLTGIAILFALPILASAAITTNLSAGSSGAQVTELQTFLSARPAIYPEGLITGYYGPLTAKAVQRYQCDKAIVCSGSASATGYGNVGPATRAAINADLGGTTPSPTGDVYAPIQSSETIATSSTSATLAWTTNEPSFGRVMYATTWPFLYATAQSGLDAALDTVTSVVLTGLSPATTYFYVRESTDLSGNVMWTTAKTFRTNP